MIDDDPEPEAGRVAADRAAELEADREDVPPFVDPNADSVTCFVCGAVIPPEDASGIDRSGPDEYYPDMAPVCPRHSGGPDEDDDDLGLEPIDTDVVDVDELADELESIDEDRLAEWTAADRPEDGEDE